MTLQKSSLYSAIKSCAAVKKATYWRSQATYRMRKAVDLSCCRISVARADCTTCCPREALSAEIVRVKLAGPKRSKARPPWDCRMFCWRMLLLSLMVWYLRSVGSF